MPPDLTAHPDIADEQAHVSVLYGHLDRMREYTHERLRTVLLQRGGTPQARSERESFTHMYTEDLTKFDAAEHGLCFGRIDLDPSENPGDAAGTDTVRYVGRLGILDEEDDYEPLLLDWRAPLARPFYLATPATPDGVVRRRHIRSRNRTVTALNDEYLDPDAATAAGAVPAAGGVAGESALLAALGAARTGHMQDIVATIQAEQDAVIRSEHRSVLVVQGGPGTGKTAVALHRAAYLLYTHRKQLEKAGVLVIGPNATFLDYIGQVLPSLGETGVLLSTIGDLYPGVRATLDDGPATAAVKGATHMTAVLTTAVRDRQTVPSTPIEISIDGTPARIDRKLATRARGRARSSRRPHNLARPLFVSVIVDGLTDQLAAALGTDPLGGANLLSADDLSEMRAQVRADDAVRAAIDELWPQLTPQRVLDDLLHSDEAIDSAGRDLTREDREHLRRHGDHGRFSADDAPLLDELAELLGVDDSAERERRERRWRRNIADAQGALDILTGSAPQDLEDDLDPEILMAYDLIDAEQLAERQDRGTDATTAERAAGDRTWAYGHVIVDEAQELSPMAWRMVMRRIPNRWMTLVGDTAQTGEPAGTTDWAEALEPYVAQRFRQVDLTVNYRTPQEIMAYAQRVLAEIDPDRTPPTSIRSSGVEPWAVRVDPTNIGTAVADTIATFDGPGTTAVIVPRARIDTLAALAEGETTVSTVHDAKGLEFDNVVIVAPDEIVDESARGLRDLYVALTRSTQRLAVVHAGALPAPLSGLSSRSATERSDGASPRVSSVPES